MAASLQKNGGEKNAEHFDALKNQKPLEKKDRCSEWACTANQEWKCAQ